MDGLVLSLGNRKILCVSDISSMFFNVCVMCQVSYRDYLLMSSNYTGQRMPYWLDQTPQSIHIDGCKTDHVP